MKKIALTVEGMSCSHCENAVKKAAGEFDGVSNVEVDLNAKTVIIEYDENKVSLDSVKNAIEDEGYDVI